MDVLLEVFHAPQTGSGPSAKVLYVQRLVSISPEEVQTFDNIFADLPVVDARVFVNGDGKDLTSVSIVLRDAAGNVLPGAIYPADPIIPIE